MKAKELAELLLSYPDFDVQFSRMETALDSKYGVSLRKWDVKLNDIGHSDKIIILGPEG